MRAVVVDRYMEPSELRVREVPEPTAGPGQVVVDVHAAACNFYDTLIIRGKYQVKPAFPFIPGGEFAGVVSHVGPDVQRFAPGDRVFGQGITGAYAEKLQVSVHAIHALPPEASFEQAAQLPIAYGTSYAALVHRTRVAAGETLLVHAAAGGVGIAAVQIGRALGARVIGTAGGAEKCAIAARAGAHATIDYQQEDFVERVNALTDGRGADLIYDSVGGDTFDRSLRCVAWNGRVLVIGFSSGKISELRLNRVLLKNISLVGLHWSAYPEREPAVLQPTYAALADMLARGEIDPVVYARFPLEALPAALEALAARRSFGKIIVKPR